MKQTCIHKIKVPTGYFQFGVLVLLSILLFTEAHPQVNERCEAQILKEFTDAICQPDQDIKSCDASCEAQAEVKCGIGRKIIRKLQCRKRKTRKGPFSCCCRVECNGDLNTPEITKNVISQKNKMDMEHQKNGNCQAPFY